MQLTRSQTAAEEHIPVFVPRTGIDTLKHLTDALDVGWLGMGAITKDFEDRIRDFLGAPGRHVVATNTGTSALHIALVAAGVGPGDEVIVPSFNYVADHQAIGYTGASVVMCDIREDDLGIDCESARSMITKKTKAIIPLHFAGIPCDQSGVFRLAEEFGLRVIEDACHAFGSTIEGNKIGSYGDIACFSFDPVKIITSIDGGCVVVNSEAELAHLQHLRLLGVDKDTTERYKNSRAWEYDVVSVGYRYHLTNIMASVGISQIKNIGAFIASRQAVCERYSAAFSHIEGLCVLRSNFADVSPFIYSIRVLRGRRMELIEFLKSRNIATGIHFMPVHNHAYFASSRRSDMPVTERISQEVLTLPLHSHMREESVNRVIDAVTDFFSD